MRTGSITGRLTLFYTLGALTALVLFAALVDWKLVANFNREQQRFLQAKTAEMQADLEDAGGHVQALLAEILKETEGTRLRQYQARVMDGRQVLGATPGMNATLPVVRFSPTASVDQLRRQTAGGHDWLLATLPLRSVRGALQVQMALDVSRDDNLLRDFHRALVVFLILLLPLLVGAGRWLSQRALAPVARIARAAEAVTPARLSARIPQTPPWPRELSGLVDTFNDMLTRLEEAFARLSRFSADLAHELRTPLANLSGELEVCLARPRSAADYRATLESGLDDCRRLIGLTENLLFMARAERADLALRRESFELAEAARWVIAQQAPAAGARGVTIELSGSVQLDADPVLVRQALANLLANAVRHAPAGSSVTVSMQTDADGARVSVSDHGAGIAAEHLPHLFERFYQADPARGRGAGQGTGLGLSIVRSIMELHGGRASISSQPGIGTTATLWFPPAAGET